MKPGDAKIEPLPYARSFRELIVYQKARTLAREVFEVTMRFTIEEAYSLTDQWRRAVRSVGGQIAESWAKRRYPRHFLSKLTDADAELQETQHWLIVAFDCAYVSADETRKLGLQAQEIGRMMGEMMKRAEEFRGEDFTPSLREECDSNYAIQRPYTENWILNTEH